MKRIIAIAALLVLVPVLAAGPTSAATSSPAAGDWRGQLKGASPKTAVTFTVTKKGKASVVGFTSRGSFKPPCKNAFPTAVGGIPSAKVSSAGKFKAVGSLGVGFGTNTWTVSGSFKSKHTATGTVAIVLFLGPSVCRFTLPWAATFEKPAPPASGATYKGKTTFGEPVTIHISASGQKLTSVRWREPLSTCAGVVPHRPVITGHNVPVHKGRFTFTQSTKGGGGDTITGQFLSGHMAQGTVSVVIKIPSLPDCRGSSSWTAHA